MPKLVPPSAAVAGILSQLGCRSHLGAHGDFSSFRGLEELKAGGMAGSQCPAQPRGLRRTEKLTPIPLSPTLFLPGPCPSAAGQEELRGSAGSTSTGTLRFFDAVRHFATGSAYIGLAQELAWPSEESNQRTHPDGNNLVGEIQVFFSGIKSLAEFIMWHTQICLHNTSGEQAAVKAASSITWFQLCCCPVFNYYTRTVC